MSLAERIRDALMHAVVELDEDVRGRIEWARAAEEQQGGTAVGSMASRAVLDAILKNLEIAKEKRLPMCQDTGLFLVFVDVGKESTLPVQDRGGDTQGCLAAVEASYYRRSVVEEPVFARKTPRTTCHRPSTTPWWMAAM